MQVLQQTAALRHPAEEMTEEVVVAVAAETARADVATARSA